MTLRLPNVRSLFLPDPGHLLLDVDLSGADAQVVAWEANDQDLKNAFRAGMKIHVKNATDLFGSAFTDAPGETSNKGTPKGAIYDQCKRAIHATNYGASPWTLTRTADIGWKTWQSERFQETYFRLHPGIGPTRNPDSWHARVARDVQTRRQVRNIFGNRIIYFDRPDNLLPKALAWIPQSTIAGVCSRGALRLRKSLPWCSILLQVHDSLVFQIPSHRASPGSFAEIRKSLEVIVPYRDPLIIPWGLAFSSKSWGEVEKKKWEEVT